MSIIRFIMDVCKLKNVPRSGWIVYGVQPIQTESVASHTFMTSFLTMIFADMFKLEGLKVDVEKTIKMALLHDLAEVLTFDISKHFLERINEGKALKKKIMVKAQKSILHNLPVKELQSNYQQMFKEFEEESIESKIVKAADSFDVLIQIIDYESKGYSKRNFEGLWQNIEKEINSLKIGFFPLLEEFKKLREGKI